MLEAMINFDHFEHFHKKLFNRLASHLFFSTGFAAVALSVALMKVSEPLFYIAICALIVSLYLTASAGVTLCQRASSHCPCGYDLAKLDFETRCEMMGFDPKALICFPGPRMPPIMFVAIIVCGFLFIADMSWLFVAGVWIIFIGLALKIDERNGHAQEFEDWLRSKCS